MSDQIGREQQSDLTKNQKTKLTILDKMILKVVNVEMNWRMRSGNELRYDYLYEQ